MKIRSIRQAPWSLAALGLALASLGAGCGSPTDPNGTPTTETFSGTIGVAGSASHNVQVAAASSNLTVTLTSLTPQSTITVGLGVGQPDATTGACTLASYTESAHVARVLTVAVNKGTLCVKIYDIGNILTTEDYTLSVAHY